MKNEKKVDLGTFTNFEFQVDASKFKRLVWYIVNTIIFETAVFPSNHFKVWLLKLFGAKAGNGIVIKPKVNIKYPWKLVLGNNVWIGENVWIDNLDQINIGDNVCISQGVLLLCGNHNYKLTTFDLITKPIIIEDGCWIGAKSIVCGGVICKSHSILSVGSVATNDLDAYSIYQGNPAIKIRDRIIT